MSKCKHCQDVQMIRPRTVHPEWPSREHVSANLHETFLWKKPLLLIKCNEKRGPVWVVVVKERPHLNDDRKDALKLQRKFTEIVVAVVNISYLIGVIIIVINWTTTIGERRERCYKQLPEEYIVKSGVSFIIEKIIIIKRKAIRKHCWILCHLNIIAWTTMICA